MVATDTTRKLVSSYLNYFNVATKPRDPQILSDLLAKDLNFQSPLGSFKDAEAFLFDLKRDVLAIDHIEIKEILIEGSRACALYEVISRDPSIGRLNFSEWYQIENGRIVAITSTHDATGVRESMARI